jgi:hypothetical protein
VFGENFDAKCANHPSRNKAITRLCELFKVTERFVTKTFGKITTANQTMQAPEDSASLEQEVTSD